MHSELASPVPARPERKFTRLSDFIPFVAQLSAPTNQKTHVRILSISFSDRDSELADIPKIVSLDPGLTAQILHLCHSAYYNRPDVDSIDYAIQVIGLDELVRLVSYLVFLNVHDHALEHYGISPDDFWRFGVCQALASQMLARKFALNEAKLYTSGLLSTLGLWVSDCFLSHIKHPKDPKLANANWLELCQWHEDKLQNNHGSIAAIYLRKLGLPQMIVNPIEYTFSYSIAPEEEVSIESKILFLAYITACFLVFPHLNPGDVESFWDDLQVPSEIRQEIASVIDLQKYLEKVYVALEKSEGLLSG